MSQLHTMEFEKESEFDKVEQMKIELREKFEKEFEDKEELAKKDLDIKQKKVEDQLRELKEFYEQDKKRMET